MITMMIVDDEAVIRKGISTAIDWESMGIHLVAEAANGRDGLTKALVLRPDIVITDVKMPVMDGIRFVQRLREKLPSVKVIILSGYSDFEYSRQALKAGAVDYLLKPVSVEELTRLMTSLRQRILQERRHQSELQRTGRLLNTSLPILRADCIRDFVQGELSEKQFLHQAEENVGIDLSGPSYQILVINIDDFYQMPISPGDRRLLRYSLANIADELLREGAMVSIGYAGEDSLLILLSLKAGTDVIVECCRQIQFYFLQYFKATVTVGIGRQVAKVSELGTSYRQAWDALERKIFKGKNRVIVAEENFAEPDESVLLLRKPDEDDLRGMLKLLQNMELQKKLDAIFREYFTGYTRSRKATKQFCIYLIGIALREMENLSLSPDAVFGESGWLYREAERYETLEELSMWVKSIYGRVFRALESHRSNQYKGVVKKGIEYAQANYRESIQVADVAKAVFVTPNYFSKIFKQEMGENFTEWLNKYRIEKAKEKIMREPDVKTYQVAMETGFKDYKYFAYIFKKYAGYTPGTYRQIMS